MKRFVLAALLMVGSALVRAADPAPPAKTLPLPGEVFAVDGHTAFVVPGRTDPAALAKPWVWYAPTLPGLPGTEEQWMFERFRDAGIAVAGIDVGESFGSPAGRKLFSDFHAAMSGPRGYSRKPVLLGRSRGGLMTLAWAAENADKVAGFAGIYPVCNVASYPGVAKAAAAYAMSPAELQAQLAAHNPVDRLASLAKAGVPLFAIHGDVDTVVPLEANSGLVKERYAALGGSMRLIVPRGQGHNMWSGFFQCQELVDFVKTAARGNAIQVIPLPARIEPGEGSFRLLPGTTLLADPAAIDAARQLADTLAPATGFRLPVRPADASAERAGTIELSLAGDAARFGDEGYELRVSTDRIRIEAARPAGAFYACQTLRQLFPPPIESRTRVEGVAWTAPVVRIEDRPQFAWRGIMIDPARQFISKAGVLKCIDWMGYHKLNRLHLHLTDVDGWRVEIKKYPRLTTVGAHADLGEGIRTGGFYTQDDIREIVAHAARCHVVVIPEIETPSHSGAAMVAYPELNCFGTRKTTALFDMDPLCGSEYCPGNDKTFEFLADVFAEVAALFPGPYIHVGGDEAEMRYWGECPKCQARQKQVGNLHGWFMERVKGMVESHGRRVVGWGGVAKNTVYTCWDNDGSGGWNAAKGGWDVVMSTGNHHYINYNIDRTTLRTAYDFDPAPASAGLSPEARRHVLGVEACLWGEMVPEDHVDSQTFPRILAIAERGWGIEHPDFDGFLGRVKTHVDRLAGMGILTGPAFGYTVAPAIPGRVRDGLGPLVYPPSRNQNDEDWRWTLTGIDRGQGYTAIHPLRAFDGDLETYHLAWGPRKDVDTFTVVVQKPDAFDRVRAITGMPNGDHRLHAGVLEVSSGYGRWKAVARFEKGVAEARLDGTPVVAVRIRSTIDQPPLALLAVREIILEKKGQSTLKALTPLERLHLPEPAAK